MKGRLFGFVKIMPIGIYIRTEEHRKSLSECKNSGHFKKGNLHPLWKGDIINKRTLHARLRRYLKKPKLCNLCKSYPPYDLANISQEYKTDLSDWEWLCRTCHMVKDGRMEKFGWIIHRRKKVVLGL